MDGLKDIWASLVNGVRERTTNPLSFAFLLSWCAWNFKFFVVLLGDGTAKQRLDAIDGMYPVALSTYVGCAFLLPLLTAAAYVFLYPFVSAKAIKFYREKQVEIANSVKGLEEKRLLTPEEVATRTRRHEAERKKWEEVEAGLESQLREVREALAASEKQVLELKTAKPQKVMQPAMPPVVASRMTIEDVEDEGDFDFSQDANKLGFDSYKKPMPKEMVAILLKISDSPSGISTSNLSSSTGENFTLVEVTLDEMRQHELVKKSETGRWLLTPKGKNIAVNILSNQR